MSQMKEALARAAIFDGVEPSAVAALTNQLRPVHFARGDTIFSEGEPGEWLYIIISGKVKVGRGSADGREHLLTIMGPSDMFGELSIFDPGPRTSTVTAITDVRAVSMDRHALRAWIADRPEIAERLLRVLAHRLRRTNDNLADLWLVHLLECGLLRGSFIPPAQIKAARDVIRYRTKLTQSRTSELKRLGNVLQDAGINVDSVASTSLNCCYCSTPAGGRALHG